MNVRERLKRLESKAGVGFEDRINAVIMRVIEVDGSMICPDAISVDGVIFNRAPSEEIEAFENRVVEMTRQRGRIVALIPCQ